ncbi:MAG TPA: hypothetical protein VF945_05080 [Polyangia bacterium]
MNRLLRLTAVVALLAPLCLAAGCKQGVNERCQVTSDCQDGLLCVLAAGATPQAGGTCQMQGGSGDMAVGADMAGVVNDLSKTASDLTPAGD